MAADKPRLITPSGELVAGGKRDASADARQLSAVNASIERLEAAEAMQRYARKRQAPLTLINPITREGILRAQFVIDGRRRWLAFARNERGRWARTRQEACTQRLLVLSGINRSSGVTASRA